MVDNSLKLCNMYNNDLKWNTTFQHENCQALKNFLLWALIRISIKYDEETYKKKVQDYLTRSYALLGNNSQPTGKEIGAANILGINVMWMITSNNSYNNNVNTNNLHLQYVWWNFLRS